MCSFVVGSDREFFKSLSAREQEKFFADCTRFFADRYGEKNIISAVVHMDETTPHLHLNLIPIAEGRLCAKQLFDRKPNNSHAPTLHDEKDYRSYIFYNLRLLKDFYKYHTYLLEKK